MDCSLLGSSVHGDSPGKDTGVGCYALFQGIFPTQGSNPGFLHCRQILYCLSHQESPKVIGACKYTVLSATVVLPPKLNGVILFGPNLIHHKIQMFLSALGFRTENVSQIFLFLEAVLFFFSFL